MTQILLSELIEKMQITVADEDDDPENDPLLNVDDVEKVEFTDEHLVEVTEVKKDEVITYNGPEGRVEDYKIETEHDFLLSSLDHKCCADAFNLFDTLNMKGEKAEVDINESTVAEIYSIFGAVDDALVEKLLFAAVLFPEI